MPSDDLSDIRSGLVSLRRQIRRVQFFRGLFDTAVVFFGGLLFIVTLDYMLPSFPIWARAAVFYLWLLAVVLAVVVFIGVPLMRKLPSIQLARWLERRHPEMQERISTVLELSEAKVGVSSSLLSELSRDAAVDLSLIDPLKEVGVKRARRSFLPLIFVVVTFVVILGVWPREVGRLLTRAVSPFSSLGNAGAFRFDISPGSVEIFEGDELTIDLAYTGSLEEGLALVIEKEGESVSETLPKVTSEGGVHCASYQVHSADVDFQYSARVAGNQSDRFLVKVQPSPRMVGPVVTLRFPAYTSWPDREFPLGNEVKALAGTEVILRGQFNTPLEAVDLLLGSSVFGESRLEHSARGEEMRWSAILNRGLDHSAKVRVEHESGRQFEVAEFMIQAVEDHSPLVKIFTPVHSDYRVKANEKITISYEVVEQIGVAKAEINLEINGKSVEPLAVDLPERVDGEEGRLWRGEARVFLEEVLSQYVDARNVRMRLAISDVRPVELDGPGVGYSKWLEFKLDQNAESLLRQELQEQDQDLRETVGRVIRDVEKAKRKMEQVRGDLQRTFLSERTENRLSESQRKLKKAKDDLANLRRRMELGIQAQRSEQVEAVMAELQQAEEAVEMISLQDHPEARLTELDQALRESQGALEGLRELQQEIQKDASRVDDLARLQEMAQRQERLARQAAESEMNQDWQNRQKRMQEEIRQKVRQSPEAKAAAMTSQSKQVLDLAEEARVLKSSQEELAEVLRNAEALAEGDEQVLAILEQALIREQEVVLTGIISELSEARRGQEGRANDLPEALAQAEAVFKEVQTGRLEMAAESAQKAARELSKGARVSASQMLLKEHQEEVAEALRDFSQGRPEEALARVERMQVRRAKGLVQEIQSVSELDGNFLGQAGQQARKASQKVSEASRSQEGGRNEEASELHQEAARQFRQASESLTQASREMAKGAEEAARQEESPEGAPAPGEEMAEALQRSTQAAQATQSREAAAEAQAAAEALRKAAEQAKVRMRGGGRSEGEMMQAKEAEAAGQGEQMTDEARSGLRERQGGQGVPPELAQLGMSMSEWEKIQATMSDEVGRSSRVKIPEDYRGLVRKYFERVIEKQ